MIHRPFPAVAVSCAIVLALFSTAPAQEATDEVSMALRSKDHEVRAEAIDRLKNKKATLVSPDALFPCLIDREAFIRTHSEIVLLDTANPAFIPSYIAAARHENARIREIAAKLLVQFSDPRITPVLVVLATDKERAVRGVAVRGLASVKDPAAAETLLAALTDEDNNVRIVAVEAVGTTGDPRAIEPLIAILDSPDVNMHPAALAALTKITGQSFGEDRGKWKDWLKHERSFVGRFMSMQQLTAAPIKLLLLAALIWTFREHRRPFTWAAIYAAASIVAAFVLHTPPVFAAVTGVLQFGLAALLFWLLDHFSDDPAIWWSLAAVGCLITII